MSLIAQLSGFPPETVRLADGVVVQFRRARAGSAGTDAGSDADAAVSHVLLHGIGSASGSWLAQLQQVHTQAPSDSHVLAWDAPGYDASTALPMAAPTAQDYAARMWAWLDALEAHQPVTLVGHSLGALMAASAAVQAPDRVRQLVLLAPAPGYSEASAELREKKLADRLAGLASLGPAGMARARAPALMSSDAGSDQIALVEHMMARIDPAGYTQAARMLADGDLRAELRRLSCPVLIASGEADTITPVQGCRKLASATGARYVSLGAVGHACQLEAAAQVNHLLALCGDAP